jgi:hypothetical protein
VSKLPDEDCGCCAHSHDASIYSRRERSVRVWQALQCWALTACVQHVTVQRALDMLARQREDSMSPELLLAVERLARLE